MLKNELLSHVICLPLKETAKTVFHSGCTTVYFPPSVQESFSCFILLPTLGIVRIQSVSHFNRYVVVSRCFNLRCPVANDVDHIFMNRLPCIYILFVEVSVFYPVFSWAVDFLRVKF